MSKDDKGKGPVWPSATPQPSRPPREEPQRDESKILPLVHPGPQAEPEGKHSGDENDKPPLLVFPADRVYRPSENRNRPETLIVLFAALDVQCPAYHHLGNFIFDPHSHESFSLVYPFVTITARGKRLAQIAYDINARKCAIIREWHPDLYDPPHKAAAVIESLIFTVPGGEE